MAVKASSEISGMSSKRRTGTTICVEPAKNMPGSKAKAITSHGVVTLPSIFAPDAPKTALKMNDVVAALRQTTTMEVIEMERHGAPARLFDFIAMRLNMPLAEVLRMVGAPRATTLRKIALGARVAGTPGQAALGMIRLLAMAQEMAEESTHPDVSNFSASRWLGDWIRKPQPALAGRKPTEFLDTPTGLEAVMRVLGALESGASI